MTQDTTHHVADAITDHHHGLMIAGASLLGEILTWLAAHADLIDKWGQYATHALILATAWVGWRKVSKR